VGRRDIGEELVGRPASETLGPPGEDPGHQEGPGVRFELDLRAVKMRQNQRE
jgi:hypothetical protein